MNILSDTQYELLSFIAACNGSANYPTVDKVELWRKNRNPREAEYKTVKVERPDLLAAYGPNPALFAAEFKGATSTMSKILGQYRGVANGLTSILASLPTTRRELVREAESPTEHLVTLTWLETVPGDEHSGLRITDLGRALLLDREREVRAEDDVTVVVLAKDDPIAYAKLMGSLANVGAGLLIDPYLDVEILHRLLLSTGITRVLIFADRANLKNKNLPAIETLLSGRLPRVNIEVRKSTDLHDRYVIADEDGAVLMLGTSLNGVTKKNTALISMPEPAAEATRKAHEKIWANAELVGPQPAAEHDEGDEEQNSEDGKKQ